MSPVGVPCDLSVVIPTYQGAASLPELCARLAATLDALDLTWEVLLIDDASPDQTPDVAREVVARHPRIRYTRLARNAGQHAATITGLRSAVGTLLVTMDDDLQQAPESIPLLLAALEAGAQVAIARFPQPAHAAWRRLGSRLVHAMTRRQGAGRPLAITSFKAYRRAAAERLVAAVPGSGPFYIGAVLQSVVRREDIVNVDVPHHSRRHGRSGYGPLALVRMAIAAVRA